MLSIDQLPIMMWTTNLYNNTVDNVDVLMEKDGYYFVQKSDKACTVLQEHQLYDTKAAAINSLRNLLVMQIETKFKELNRLIPD